MACYHVGAAEMWRQSHLENMGRITERLRAELEKMKAADLKHQQLIDAYLTETADRLRELEKLSRK